MSIRIEVRLARSELLFMQSLLNGIYVYFSMNSKVIEPSLGYLEAEWIFILAWRQCVLASRARPHYILCGEDGEDFIQHLGLCQSALLLMPGYYRLTYLVDLQLGLIPLIRVMRAWPTDHASQSRPALALKFDCDCGYGLLGKERQEDAALNLVEIRERAVRAI